MSKAVPGKKLPEGSSPAPEQRSSNGNPATGSHDIVVIGASAGGVEAVRSLISILPRNLNAAMFVVVHTPEDGAGMLAGVLSRAAAVTVVSAEDGMKIERGTAYVAPPGYHMLVDSDRVRLLKGPHHNRHRPAIDPLFFSAARAFGPRVLGLVLTGYLDDGVAGLAVVKRNGGIAVVQDPEDAFVPDMPRNALHSVAVDYCLPLAEIPALILQLSRVPPEHAMKNAKNSGPKEAPQRLLSSFTCPECHGSLWEISEEPSIFECRVGHSYTSETLFADQNDSVERALWAALKSLQENAELARRLGQRSSARGHRLAANRFLKRAAVADNNASVLRAVLNGPADPGHRQLLDRPEEEPTRVE